MGSIPVHQYTTQDLSKFFDKCWTEELNHLRNPMHSVYSWINPTFSRINLKSPLNNGETVFIEHLIRYKIRECIPKYLFTSVSPILGSIHQDFLNLSTNLSILIQFPTISAKTCRLPSSEQLWEISETINTIQFCFKPYIREKPFKFQHLKTSLKLSKRGLDSLTLTDIFHQPPTLQYVAKGITLFQPVTLPVMKIPSSHTTGLMGIDLGLKTLATLSIGSEVDETARVFISLAKLSTTRVDPVLGRLIPNNNPNRNVGNIGRRLYNLRQIVRQKRRQLDLTSNLPF
ncbi:hypothetical protein KA005_29170, partial [bacterium]|nr:hypothetical protein [bacterium]